MFKIFTINRVNILLCIKTNLMFVLFIQTKEKVAVVNEKEMAKDVYFKSEIQSRCHRETEKGEQAALMKAIEEATSVSGSLMYQQHLCVCVLYTH